MTIADKQHIEPAIKVKAKFQVKAYQTLYTTNWHFQNCSCYMCLLITLMHSVLSLWAIHAQVDPMCMVTLGCQYQFQITGLHEDPPTTPQWSVQYTNRQTHSIQNPMYTLIRWIIHACTKTYRKIPITRKVSNIKQILGNFEQTMDIKEKFIQHCHIGTNLKKAGLYRTDALWDPFKHTKFQI